ncbi:ABC transporter substrate-binding protein [Nocardiopsis sp. CNT-189]|uniref:hypothetical protein n=1 Tax=Nocardiopsis oceanisediminis TaxID=2816862 RepID=UPI003B2D3B57
MRAATPRLPGRATAGHTAPPAPATGAELAALVGLAARTGARSVVLGSGRDQAARESAARFARAWEEAGGAVLDTVSWPEEAASWLRQARRLTCPEPDLWVLGGAAAGLAQMIRRLAWSTPWTPRRTLALGAAAVRAGRLAGADLAEGMRGAHPDGALWRITGGGVSPLHPLAAERGPR